MNGLQLVKSGNFEGVQADFYSNEKDVFMTAQQLGECLGYSNPRESINKLVSRNEYLRNKTFSAEVKLTSPRGDRQNTRVFNEDGIYEIAFKANTDKALEFREWVRKILKSLRKGEAKIVGMSEYQRMMTQTRAENAKIRKAQLLTRLAERYNGTYRQILESYATKELTGEHLLPLPQLPEKVYTAQEIGDRLGITANMVGRLANRYNLKIDKYGALFNDKSPNSNKEVQTFKYYKNVIPVIEKLIASKEIS